MQIPQTLKSEKFNSVYREYHRLRFHEWERDLPSIHPEWVAGLKHLGLINGSDYQSILDLPVDAPVHWVPEHVIAEDYFLSLAQGHLPLAVAFRSFEEIEHASSPDFFHDLFGHLPMIFWQPFLNLSQALARAYMEHVKHRDEIEKLFLWFFEFGALKTEEGPRVVGAGILSSLTELKRFSFGNVRLEEFSIESLKKDINFEGLQDQFFLFDSLEHVQNSLDKIVKG